MPRVGKQPMARRGLAADLKFLAVSTRLSPEVCEYPDTGRFGLLAEMPSAADGRPRELRFVGRAGESLEYWQGE